ILKILFKIFLDVKKIPNIKNNVINIGVDINIQVGRYDLGKYFII
mgnify:CR=1